MQRLFFSVILLVVAASARAGEVDRLYVIDCGWAHATDQSRWSPGINAGVPIDLSDNCYLIHHTSEGYLLWDTGITVINHWQLGGRKPYGARLFGVFALVQIGFKFPFGERRIGPLSP
jgi:hypothetical protein